MFMIFQGLSPTLWAAVGDFMGRRSVYIATTTLYIYSNVGLSFTYHYWLLLLLRCVQSTGSASVVALGSGTIGDLIPPARRGGWMSIYNIFTMI
ncbi:hypothetical protein MVLG_02068 [Microbotryum lychnidis-dioicae p1A1 Lamole]|uniref:Major facilitator superfamily (MFS) profile domain-containing protein n=1 Tax=Microbotryum lychnidis-dioicae (strain p1A1 Lamole / MvSl-1064) TaxID=683840 RepID=U5H417_USTV1|nr:hypothetical protein MVLG_02068 [Microbotryum lychnidis-dioicae p1A1 Lamole]|eukprot:KDE07602.1 hypothetical protein MVLG_02068 [Microbotryum lychnidis-dioicae p1A1 Lamole]